MKFLFLLLAIVISTSYGSIINVPQEISSIQSAIDAAENGDTVLVSPGVYFENITFRGKNIVVTSNYIFSGNASDIETTVINGSQPVSPDSASCVRIVSNEDSTAQLIGFTLTGGTGTKWIDEHGAGTYREGGGILITLASPVIKYNRIVNNEASNLSGVTSAGGGGIRAGDGNPLIEGNFIAYNKGRYGAGLVLNYTGAMVRNNIFYRNTGGEDFGGGGIWALEAGPAPKIIINNVVVENSSTAKGGGGLYIWSASLQLRNNIICKNTGGTTPNIRLVSGAALSAEYNLIEGGYSGTGNFDGNPMFLSDFTLSPGSPCIDAGDTSIIYNDLEDSANPGFPKEPSKGTLRNDAGAYGGPYIITYSQIINPVEEETGAAIPEKFNLFGNYPNPFNPETVISYSLPRGEYVVLKIYNSLGEEVTTLVNELQNAGIHKIKFAAYELPSGIYFYRIQSGDFVQTKKMILMK